MKDDNSILKNVRYCTRCCVPETQEGVTFDELGICKACQSSEQKMHIDWNKREKQLRKIFEEAKAKAGNNYDCILPISGGKDSAYQAYVLTQVYGMKPLAVTFNQNWQSETGFYNLQNLLREFNIDHIMYTPNKNLVSKLAKRSLEKIGDACWHCHAGVGAFPLQIAVKFKIPLLIYGESVAESSGRGDYECPVTKYDRDYFTKVSAKVLPKDMVCEYLSEKDLYPFELPSYEEIEAAGVWGIHLGDYIFWDEERQMEFMRDNYGWRETEMEGAYKGFKSAECIMSGIHDFTCYLKRGFGRTTFQTSVDIRSGLMTREEAFELIKKHDTERPEALDYYLKITGMTEEEFYETMKKQSVDAIKNVDLPITPKNHKNAELIKPFVEQVIDKIKTRKDPREAGLNEK